MGDRYILVVLADYDTEVATAREILCIGEVNMRALSLAKARRVITACSAQVEGTRVVYDRRLGRVSLYLWEPNIKDIGTDGVRGCRVESTTLQQVVRTRSSSFLRRRET